jgi:hypothetical protein
VHEELRRASLQDRVSDVPEVLQKVGAIELRVRRVKCFIAALATGMGALVALDAGFVAAESLRGSSAPDRSRSASVNPFYQRLVLSRLEGA